MNVAVSPFGRGTTSNAAGADTPGQANGATPDWIAARRSSSNFRSESEKPFMLSAVSSAPGPTINSIRRPRSDFMIS